MIKYKIGNVTTHVNIRLFKDGAVNVNINTNAIKPRVEAGHIELHVQFGHPQVNMNDMIMALAQTVDALRFQYPNYELHLRMPYMPYARQDRACSPGEAFSLRVVAKMINAMDFKTVSVLDPHSAVTAGVLDRMYPGTQLDVFQGIKTNWSETYIVAPDAGAMKKAEEFAKGVFAKGVITFAKERNMETIAINSLRAIDPIPAKANLLILDDICDGGRTFIGVAQAIRDTCPDHGSIELAITHGLFTFGTEIVTKHFDKVYTTNSYYRAEDHMDDKLKVVDIW